MNNTKTLALGLLILLGIIWGTGYSIARFAMTNGVSPLGYSFWQSLGPAIFMGCLGLSQRKTITLDIPHLRYYIICGLTGIVIPNTNMYFASAHLPAGILAVVVNIVPIIAYPMAMFAKIEKFQWMRFLGVGCAIGGVMLIILPKAIFPEMHISSWALMALITPCSFAFCSVYISRFRPANHDSLSLATGTLIASTLLLLPLVLIKGDFYMLHLPFNAPDRVIILEIVLSSIGYVLFFQLIKVAGPVYYSLVDTIVSLTGLMWGYVLFHERLNHWVSMAIFLILLGLISVTQQQHVIQRSRAQRAPSG